MLLVYTFMDGVIYTMFLVYTFIAGVIYTMLLVYTFMDGHDVKINACVVKS